MDKNNNFWYNDFNNMTPEQIEQQKQDILSAIEPAIDKYVNGKIDKLHVKVDRIVKVIDWFGSLIKAIKYLGGVAAALTAILLLFKFLA